MADEKRTFLMVGLGMIGAGVVFGLLGGISDAAFGALAGFSGTLVFFGIVILVIAAFRGGSRQQQQQQVVVVTGGSGQAKPEDGGGEAAVRCPDCSALNPVRATYCGQCGHGLGR